MNILVCVKQVPDTASVIKVGADGKRIDEAGIKWVVNPYDEYGIEEALRIKEKLGSGTVTLVSVGSDRVVEALRTGIAMGADEAILLKDDPFVGSDPLGIAKILAKAIQSQALSYDLIFCGKQAVDDDAWSVGAFLAALLNLPQICVVKALEVSGDQKSVTAEREVEGGVEVVECPLPVLLTAQKGLNEPRYATLPNIMKAKKKEIKVLSAEDLGIDPNTIGIKGAKVEVEQVAQPPARTGAKIIDQGDLAASVKEVVRLLKEEAKVI